MSKCSTKRILSGVVVNCLELNVLKAPSTGSEVADTISALTKVLVDPAQSTDEFFKVSAESGAQGFCMKKFIAIRR